MAAALPSFSAVFFIAIISLTSAASASDRVMSTISAAPTLLPETESPFPAPLSPSLSPDVEPQMPNTTPSPDASSSMPTIPATPSPPNPDAAMDIPSVAASSPSDSPFPPPLSSSALISALPPLKKLLVLSVCLVPFW
ncbi:hypothetical protein LINPERPRIM_LOCUS43394 [Linum perenne]